MILITGFAHYLLIVCLIPALSSCVIPAANNLEIIKESRTMKSSQLLKNVRNAKNNL